MSSDMLRLGHTFVVLEDRAILLGAAEGKKIDGRSACCSLR
jgi:hypothetical protein